MDVSSLTRPSTTAAVVASTQLVLEHHPRLGSLVDPRSAALIRRALSAIYPRLAPLFEPSRTRRVLPLALAAERMLSPGFVTYYALRKAGVRAAIELAIDDGFHQIVLVGAGLDMLSVSLSQRAPLTIIEVDLPATQRAKLEALYDVPGIEAITSTGVDLSSASLRRALERCSSFDSGKDTVFVAEGVFMYLPPDRVDAVFESMHAASVGRRRVIFSVVSPDASGRVRIHSQSSAVDLCMRLLGETFKWGLGSEDVERFLSRRGWSLDSIQTTDALRSRFLAPIDAAHVPNTGELLVVGTAVEDGVTRA
jgi:methyltransferase (TIGR00027 family)